MVNRAYYQKKPDVCLEANRRYLSTEKGKEARARAQRAYRAKHRTKQIARDRVAYAVKTGQLVPWPTCAVPGCCGKPEAHHPDYSTPLDVVWLCSEHHKDAHTQTRQVLREQLCEA